MITDFPVILAGVATHVRKITMMNQRCVLEAFVSNSNVYWNLTTEDGQKDIELSINELMQILSQFPVHLREQIAAELNKSRGTP